MNQPILFTKNQLSILTKHSTDKLIQLICKFISCSTIISTENLKISYISYSVRDFYIKIICSTEIFLKNQLKK